MEHDNTPHNELRVAIIVAGGSGTRFGADVPKQFVLLDGKPVMMHTISKFAAAGAEIIVVLPSEQFDTWHDLCARHHFSHKHRVVAGGATRFHSVKNAVDALVDVGDDTLIAVHDAVRPLVTPALIEDAYRQAALHGSAIPYVPATDSIRLLDADGGSNVLDRSRVALIQTPQVFRADIIKRAYRQPYNSIFTDDASVAESILANDKRRLRLIDGETTNIKITYPKDLALAEHFMRQQ